MNEPRPTKPAARSSRKLPPRQLTLAGLLIALYLITDLLGWRRHAGFLSLTPADANESQVWSGAIYVCARFLAFTLAPILVIGAGWVAVLRRLFR